MKNKTIFTFYIFILFFSFFSKNAYASGNKDLIINNNKVNTRINQNFNGDYFLPLKDVITGLGGSASFDSKTSALVFDLANNTFHYYIDTNKIDHTIDDKTEIINNHFDIKLENGKSFITLSFLNKFLDISYEKSNGNLYISSLEKLSNNFSIKPLLVAHGGGEIDNITISNSLEAINKSIRHGSRLIELDFLKTIDKEFVLGHDWGRAFKLFNLPPGSKTYGEYILKNDQLLTPIGMDELVDILEDNKDLSIVTDTKDDNKELLKYISNNYRNYMDQFNPQVYSIDEYYFAKSLGFTNIIYSLYKVYLTDDEVYDFASNHDIYAITMGEVRAQSGLAHRLYNIGVMSYVHTINDLDLIKKYQKLGVTGFYTDNLY